MKIGVFYDFFERRHVFLWTPTSFAFTNKRTRIRRAGVQTFMHVLMSANIFDQYLAHPKIPIPRTLSIPLGVSARISGSGTHSSVVTAA